MPYRLRAGVANNRSRLLPRATWLCGRSWSEPQLSVQCTHAPSGHHRQARVGSETGSFIGMCPGLEPRGKDIGARNVLPVVLDVKEASRWTACDIFPPRNL